MDPQTTRNCDLLPHVLKCAHTVVLEKGKTQPGWDWKEIEAEITILFDKLKSYSTFFGGAALIAGGTAVVLPTALLAALNAIGFSAIGPVGGSLAAGIQSVLYGGATGGLFSSAQSFAMTAVGGPVPLVVAGVVAVLIGIWLVRRELKAQAVLKANGKASGQVTAPAKAQAMAREVSEKVVSAAGTVTAAAKHCPSIIFNSPMLSRFLKK
ncbi:hypothetical protein PLICRDRAFT_170718 [Plicaturopsis crispa FD-325 SS-3]|nr:hypothetical protein PLICRDRAFT_170718 [Plicaturopsis crispa FD-325 SS-3]